MQFTIYYIIRSLINTNHNYLYFLLLLINLNFHLNQISNFYKAGHLHGLIFLINKNLFIILYWLIILISSIILFEIVTSHFTVRKIIKRKFFHFLAILIYLPGYIYMEEDLLLAISIIMIYVMILLELIRNKLNSYKFFNFINEYLKSNIDERDNQKFIVTHIFLLYGCFSSLLYWKIQSEEGLKLFRWEFNIQSLAVMGVGDAMASIIGSKYGRTIIFPPTSRSLDGFLSACISTFIFLTLCSTYYFNVKSFLSLIVIFVYEGFTLQIDNLVLPIVTSKIFQLFD
jgi:dolichol kinase